MTINLCVSSFGAWEIVVMQEYSINSTKFFSFLKRKFRDLLHVKYEIYLFVNSASNYTQIYTHIHIPTNTTF